MTLVEHLEELRSTIIRVGLILFVSFFVAYGLGEYIAEFLLTPLRGALGAKASGQIVYLGLLDKVLAQLQVAFWTSILLSSPLWFWQVWRFIRPGLYTHEARAVAPFLVVGFFLFWSGVAFGYYLVFPVTFEMLMAFGVGEVQAMISLRDYLVLASKVLVFLGVIFQLPNAMIVLGFMGVVTKQSLRKWRRYVYVAFGAVAATITPPDIMTMSALWLPLVVLYEFGIWAVALIVHPYLYRQHMKSDSSAKSSGPD